MLRNLPHLGQILEARVGFATRSAVSGPLWGTTLFHSAVRSLQEADTQQTSILKVGRNHPQSGVILSYLIWAYQEFARYVKSPIFV